MKKDVMKKWVKALRSGDYVQRAEALRSKEAYCCLGVLCDISKVGAWSDSDYYVCTNSSDEAMLPQKVQDWAGMASKAGAWEGDPIHRKMTLLALNDTMTWNEQTGTKHKHTFQEIADIIEKEWESL